MDPTVTPVADVSSIVIMESPSTVVSYVTNAPLWRDFPTSLPSIEATQVFLTGIRDSPHSYMEVIPVFLSELQKHVTTRVAILNSATVESLRSLTDVIVKEASTSAAALIVDVSGVIASAEAGLEKSKEAIDALAKAVEQKDVVAVAGTALHVVETVAETAEKIADGVGDAGKTVNETVGNAKAVLESAGLGGEAVTKVADAIQTSVGAVIEVAEKAEEIAKKVDDVVEKAEVVVAHATRLHSRMAPVLAVLKRYLCCCCKKSA